MNNINMLDLSHNFIRYFDEKFTPQIDLIPYSLAISLESNPVECSCRCLSLLKWFQQKTNSHSVTFINYHLYNCSDAKGSPINDGFATTDTIIHKLDIKCRNAEWYVLVNVSF